ncbi:MAG: hypothetical protein K0S33_1203 [Bacteroidetes bacterium]|jgi:hypothetical protein|nr:hypothetical protein [Bacteroidota bacterium]
MKMHKTSLKYFYLGMAVLLFATCKKETSNPPPSDTETTTSYTHSYFENASGDVDLIGDQAGNQDTVHSLTTYKIVNPGVFSPLSACATINVQRSDTSNTDTLTVDFGSTNCICSDGKIRMGKLQYIYAGGKHYRDSGLVITCNLVNYSVEGNVMNGVKNITNLGMNAAGHLTWYISEYLVINKANGGGNLTWNAAKSKELLNTANVYTGPSTPINWLQAKIAIGGTTNGTLETGVSFTANIISPLVRDFSCAPSPLFQHRHPFIKGAINLTPAAKPVRIIDFGSSTCDFAATIKLEGVLYTFGI